MRLLLGDANRRKRVQYGPALYFQFPCQIVDSNFVHPSLFSFPAALAVHVSLIAVAITIVSVLSENASSHFRDFSGAQPVWLATVVPVRVNPLVCRLLGLLYHLIHGVVVQLNTRFARIRVAERIVL